MTTSPLEDKSLRVTVADRAVVWTLATGDAELQLGSKPSERVPLRQVLWVEAHEGAVNVKFLRSERGSLKLASVGTIACEEDRAHVERWAGAVMDAAYHGLPRRRRLRVLINPASGKGQGPAMFRDIVQPILGAALCEVDVTQTSHSGHAREIARELPLDAFDAVLCLSGDGLLHEVVNGFKDHAEPARALRVPLAPIPTGSGNATCLNLLGLKEGLDVAEATLNAIKGHAMPTDIFSVSLSNDQRVLALLSQTVGLLTDADFNTEWLRWMGSIRFIWGVIREVTLYHQCPAEVSIKVEEDNRPKMVKTYNSERDAAIRQSPPWENAAESEDVGLPPLQYPTVDSENGWITFNKPILSVTAGQGPFTSPEMMQFPVSHPADGCIDLAVWERRSRFDVIKLLVGGATMGEAFWMPVQHYYKATAYRLRPLASHPRAGRTRLSIDGEPYPFVGDVRVEVHRGLGRLLSPKNHYAPHFVLGQDGRPVG